MFCIRQTQGENGSTMAQYINYLLTSRKPTIRLWEKYTTFSLNCFHMKLVSLIKMCLTNPSLWYANFRQTLVWYICFSELPEKEGDLSLLLFNLSLYYAIKKVQEN
jgi:hypothetical protein